MPHSTRRITSIILLPLACACGPLSPAPTDTSTSSGSTAPAPETTSDSVGESGPTSGELPPTTTTTTTTGADSTGPASSTTGSTSGGFDPSSTTADPGDTSTSSGDTTTGDPAPCGPFCEPSRETCPPEAQVNASVAGETPLGAFAATFAAQSLPNVFGASFYMVLIPSYSDGDLCTQLPQLRLTLPNTCWESGTELEAPAELLDGQDVVATTTALLHNYDCTWWGFQCDACEGHVAFDLEVVDDGWSLGGSVDAGCCRTFYDNNSP